MAERAERLDVVGLRWSAGAPQPVLLATETRTLLAFYMDERDMVDGQEVRIAEFIRCTSVVIGPPNDEALHGHRLWGKGLEYYALHEVLDSAWIRELRAVENVHPRAPDVPFPESRHFVLTFHDSTLESVAVAVVPLGRYPSMPAAVMAMASS